MGQFSWFTQDTHHRIQNGVCHRVCMTDDKGNQYWEDCYEGYGEFGGKDYFELMAEMNGFKVTDFKGYSDPHDHLRMKGISLAFDEDTYGTSKKWKHPSLTENGEYYNGVAPDPDPCQGLPDEWLGDDEEDYDYES